MGVSAPEQKSHLLAPAVKGKGGGWEVGKKGLKGEQVLLQVGV